MDNHQKIINTILNSKRLLAEHVDLLQTYTVDGQEEAQWLHHRRTNTIRRSLTLATCVAGTLLLPTRFFFVRCTVSIALGTYEILRLIHLHYLSGQPQRLIEAFDSFDLSIKRHIIYFREAKLLQTADGNVPVDAARRCIAAIKLVTRAAYETAVRLEMNPLPVDAADRYECTEELARCDLYQIPIDQLDSNAIKDFYNIFLYIQSQLLVRLGLSIVHDTTVAAESSLHMCQPLIEIVRKNTNALSTTFVQQKTPRTISRVFPNELTIDPAAHVRGYSLNFTARLVAVTEECVRLDSQIQSTAMSSFDQMLEPMKHIEDALNLCTTDFQRILLGVHRLSTCHDENNVSAVPIEGSLGTTEDGTDPNNGIDLTEYVPVEPEFFAGRPDEGDNDESKKNVVECDMSLVENRVIRQQFRPVLRQLKVKLDPINASVRDRELAYLRSKGFVDDDAAMEKKSERNDDSSDSDPEMGASKKYSNRFDEMREFLQTKQQIGFLPLLPAGHGSIHQDEEILE